MASTPAPSRLPASAGWKSRAQAFWSWWTGELGLWARSRFGGLPGFAPAPLVAIESDAIVLLEARNGTLHEVSRSPIASLDPEGRRLALRNLLGTQGAPDGRVRLCLPREQSLLRRVVLPLATQENLERVLAFEMDRLTPFRAEDVYYDHRVARRDAAASQIHVDLGVARREIVDAAIARARDCGGEPAGVLLTDDVARSSEPLDLLPAGHAARGRAGNDRALRLGAGIAAVVLLLGALIVPLWQKREQVKVLIPLEQKGRSEAEATQRLASQLEKQAADYNFLLAKKHAGQPTLAILEELSQLLPDNTWVQQIDIRPAGKNREVVITGETASASKLIEILEQSSRVGNSMPRGSTTRGSQPGTERFVIASEVKPRQLPGGEGAK